MVTMVNPLLATKKSPCGAISVHSDLFSVDPTEIHCQLREVYVWQHFHARPLDNGEFLKNGSTDIEDD